MSTEVEAMGQLQPVGGRGEGGERDELSFSVIRAGNFVTVDDCHREGP